MHAARRSSDVGAKVIPTSGTRRETLRRLLHARVVQKRKRRLLAVPTWAGLRERAQKEGLRTPLPQANALPSTAHSVSRCLPWETDCASTVSLWLGRSTPQTSSSLVRRLQIFQSLSPSLPQSCCRQLYTMDGRRALSCQSRGKRPQCMRAESIIGFRNCVPSLS